MKSNGKSILIIGINFFPEPTGIGKYTGEFAFALSERGYQVDVITSYPYYPDWKVASNYNHYWYKHEHIDGVNVTRCPFYVPSSPGGAKRMLQDLSFFLSSFFAVIGKLLSSRKYDLLFIPSPSLLSGFLGVFWKLFSKQTRFVYHIQDLQVDAAEELGMIKSNILLNLLKKGEGLILRKADCVSTISRGMESKISRKPYSLKEQYIFPNWVDFGNIYKKEPDISAIKKLGIPLDKKLVFYSGAVGEKQGLDIVLDVAEKALKNLPELAFVIAGSGPYAAILKQQAITRKIDNLHFIDLQPIEVFNELLNFAFLHLVIQKEKASDLLLPSKLTNILAVGGLALVTASPGTTLFEIINGYNVGIAITPDNREAFWNVLIDLTGSDQKPEMLKENASTYARKFLDKNSIIDAFLKHFNLFEKNNQPILAE